MINHTTCKTTKNPTKRFAHFIKPSLNPNAIPPKLPKIQSFSSSSKPNVVFLSHSTPLKGWKTWVENLQETHEPVWRKAGIFDAIKCSTYHIPKVSDLILSLVEKWCPETNTFVFPWGEATVTLEDVYILGGFSPLGAPVRSNFRSILDKNEQRIEDWLLESYSKLSNPKMYQKKWLEHFMGIGNELEYAAFLSLWLSRHIFVGGSNWTITRAVFATAARISCGAKLAFGPAILASIYRDLTLLKNGFGSQMRVSSLLHLVQVWAWERFPSLGAVPRMIGCGEVRLARWEIKAREFSRGIEVTLMCLDSDRETFIWRPYRVSLENWSLPRFYVDSGMWVVAGSHERWRLFARFLMVGELDGFYFVEGYNPHRVALQFGFDQDIPESVDGSEASFTFGDVGNMKMYLPPRLQEGDVTYRYFNWWRTIVNVSDEEGVGCKRKKKTRLRVEKRVKIRDTSQERGVIIGVAKNVKGKSLEKSPPIEDMEEEMENEAWVSDESVNKGSNNSDCSNFQKEEKENEINISCSKLGEVETNRSVDQEDENMKLSEMLLEKKQNCDAVISLCSNVTAKYQNLGNEVGQVKVTSPLIVPEGGGSGKCEDNAREQYKEPNVTEHNVKMDKSSECLAAIVPQTETASESEGTLIKVASEDEPAHDNIIPVIDKVVVIDVEDDCDRNTFAAFCLKYESRMSRLEKMILAGKVTCSH